MYGNTGQRFSQPGMDNPPEKLRIKIRRDERDFFPKVFDMAKSRATNKVEGREGLSFFLKSGLDKNVIRGIWQMSAQTNPMSLDRDEFYLALRLVALAQSGNEVSDESIINNVETPLPYLDSISPMQMPMSMPGQMQMPGQMGMPGQMPMQGQMPMSMGGQMPMQMSNQTQMPMQQPPVQSFEYQIPVNKYAITEEELKKYLKLFEGQDVYNSGFISYEQMTEIMKKTGLPNATLKIVWDLASQVPGNDQGNFDKVTTIVALHILVKCKAGVEAPQAIPQDLQAIIYQYVNSQGNFQPAPVGLYSVPALPGLASTKPKNDDPFAEIATGAEGMPPMYANPMMPVSNYQPTVQAPPQQTMESEIFSNPPKQPPSQYSGPDMKSEIMQLNSVKYEVQNLKNKIAEQNALYAKEEENARNYQNELNKITNEYVNSTKELEKLMKQYIETIQMMGRPPASPKKQQAPTPPHSNSSVRPNGNQTKNTPSAVPQKKEEKKANPFTKTTPAKNDFDWGAQSNDVFGNSGTSKVQPQDSQDAFEFY